MKVCVTGGSGFIGCYFCRELTARDDEVVVLDLIDPPAGVPHHRFVRGDIRDPVAVREALDGCEAVVNLAAAHHDFGIADETYFSVNEGGSRIVCAAMDELGIGRAVFYSTVAVYGAAPSPLAETTEPRPLTPYGASKLAGEVVFREWTEQGGGRRCLVIRPTVTFGVDNFANVYSLIRQIHGRKFLKIGRGDNIKSLSFVDNLVAATLHLAGRDELPAFDVYNYVDKPDLTSHGIADVIYEALGRRAPRWRAPLWMALVAGLPFDAVIAVTGRNLPISTARMRKLCTETLFEADKVRAAGFEAPVPLAEGLRRMVAWYLEKGRHESAQWHQPPAEPVLSRPVTPAA
ncbi:MAG: NAD-dependent epimerase/dehydratase family protein [Planctomycetota bacterium]